MVFISSFSDEAGGTTRHPMAPTWPLEMLSTFTFEEQPGGKTKVTIRWSPHNATEEERKTFDAGHDSMRQGWSGTLEQLEAYLAKALNARDDMLKIVAIVAAVLVVAIAVVLVMAATKPDVFRVQRATAINAPPEKIFPLINDFRNWAAWSPYESKDPAMKRSYGSTTERQGRRLRVGRQQQRRQRPHHHHGCRAAGERQDQPGHDPAVRGPQHRRVHAGAAGRTRPR